MILVSIRQYVSKCPILKKSGNLLNDPRIKVPMKKPPGNLFNDSRINVPILKKSGNLFSDPRINKRAHIKYIRKLI